MADDESVWYFTIIPGWDVPAGSSQDQCAAVGRQWAQWTAEAKGIGWHEIQGLSFWTTWKERKKDYATAGYPHPFGDDDAPVFVYGCVAHEPFGEVTDAQAVPSTSPHNIGNTPT